MVRPTVANRIEALDFLRGVAILGILLANIWAFGFPFIDELKHFVSPKPGEGALQAAITALVSGKFRSMLAVLFGIGIWLQFRKRKPVGTWPGGYLKRTLFLALIGLFHGLFIWFGDILFTYAIMATVACLLVELDDRVLKKVIAVCGALAVLGALLFLLLGYVMSAEDFTKGMGSFGPSRSEEIAIYARGSYLDQIGPRSLAFLSGAMGAVVLFPMLLPLFLLGILLARHRVVEAPSRHPRAVRWLLGVCVGVGLPLNLLAFPLATTAANGLASFAWEFVGGPLLGPGYLVIGAIAVERGWLAPLRRAVALVGRMALSNYLLQSLVCTAVFYSYGGGLFGQLSAIQALSVVPAVWAANLLFSALWMRRFAMGPVEWAWRCMTEGKRLPILKADYPEPDPLVARPAFRFEI